MTEFATAEAGIRQLHARYTDAEARRYYGDGKDLPHRELRVEERQHQHCNRPLLRAVHRRRGRLEICLASVPTALPGANGGTFFDNPDYGPPPGMPDIAADTTDHASARWDFHLQSAGRIQGRSRVTDKPPLSRLASWIRPPCASAISRASARPMPVPLRLVE
jgi:hypothetical protein